MRRILDFKETYEASLFNLIRQFVQYHVTLLLQNRDDKVVTPFRNLERLYFLDVVRNGFKAIIYSYAVVLLQNWKISNKSTNFIALFLVFSFLNNTCNSEASLLIRDVEDSDNCEFVRTVLSQKASIVYSN